MPYSSIRKATAGSRIEIEEVTAANSNNEKNTSASNWPPAICANRAGIVIKVKPGPAAGSTWKANTAGRIIKPANTEAIVARPAIHKPALTILVSSLKYEPYAIIRPAPTDSENTAKPSASNTILIDSLLQSGVIKYITPSIAPGSVRLRYTRNNINANNTGINTLQIRSIPACTPATTISAVIPIKPAV